jgi:hypothetical protein
MAREGYCLPMRQPGRNLIRLPSRHRRVGCLARIDRIMRAKSLCPERSRRTNMALSRPELVAPMRTQRSIPELPWLDVEIPVALVIVADPASEKLMH